MRTTPPLSKRGIAISRSGPSEPVSERRTGLGSVVGERTMNEKATDHAGGGVSAARDVARGGVPVRGGVGRDGLGRGEQTFGGVRRPQQTPTASSGDLGLAEGRVAEVGSPLDRLAIEGGMI